MPPPDAAEAWEALFWTVFKRSRNPMSLVDEDRRYVDINPVHAEIFGRTREEIIGTRLDDNLPPSELATVEAEHERFQRTGQFSGERRYVRGDGSIVRVQYAARAETLTGRHLALYVTHIVTPEDEEDEEAAAPAVLHNGNGDALSPREREVVRHVAMGMTSRQIGAELEVSTETVRTHIRNALAKTGTRTRAQLVAHVMGTGSMAR